MNRSIHWYVIVMIGLLCLGILGCFGESSDSGIPAPSNVQLNVDTNNRVTITWDGVEGAESYKIYKSFYLMRDEQEIDSDIIKKDTKYTADDFQWGRTYYISIKSISKDSESIFSYPVSMKLKVLNPFPPTDVKTTSSNGEIGLRWEKGVGAFGYKIYMAEGDNGLFLDITPVEQGISYFQQNVFSAINLINGKKYRFKIRSINSTGESIDYSEIVEDTPWDTNKAQVGNISDKAFANYVVINNESIYSNMTQSTGSMPNLNQQNKILKRGSNKNILDNEAFKIDPVLPQVLGEKIKVKRAPTPILGTKREFWTYDFATESNIKTIGTLQFIGNNVEIWAESTNEITYNIAQKIATEFDNKIYSSVINNFYTPSDVDSNGKVIIFVLDIQDGWAPGRSYIGGYFWSKDLYRNSTSNTCEILYIDTYPALRTSYSSDINLSAAFTIIVHEMQHMVNYNRNIYSKPTETDRKYFPEWLDEGMSMAAEQIYTNSVIKQRIDYYNYSESIANGHSVLYWDRKGDVLSNYALSYLFMQYFKARCGQGNTIFKEIFNADKSGIEAVEFVAQKYIAPSITLGKLLTDFRLALFLKQTTGPYGFGGEAGFNTINSQFYTGEGTDLRGGGAVLKQVNGNFTKPFEAGTDIKFVGITK